MVGPKYDVIILDDPLLPETPEEVERKRKAMEVWWRTVLVTGVGMRHQYLPDSHPAVTTSSSSS